MTNKTMLKEERRFVKDHDEEEEVKKMIGYIVNKKLNEEEEKEDTHISNKKPKLNSDTNDHTNFSDDDQDLVRTVSRESKEDGLVFAFAPTKDMTGVEPHMTHLCSTISQQLYEKKSKDDFKLSTNGHKYEVLIYDDHGEFKNVTVPFLVLVPVKEEDDQEHNHTMILGWRGTSTFLDDLNDLAASPQSSLAWKKHAKTIKAQGPMNSIVQNDIVTHQATIIKEAKKRGIREIITTGQSLGGGCAQLGHLILRAQMEDEDSPWSALEGVNVRSVAFCAPMTTVLLDNANASDETIEFLVKLWCNSCNMIYSNDIVPRAYGYTDFLEAFAENASGGLVDKTHLPWFVKAYLKFFKIPEKMIHAFEGKENVKNLLGVYSQYRHVGNVIYYKSEDAKPCVLWDMGAPHKNDDTRMKDNLLNGRKDLRAVKYHSPPEDTKPLDEVMKWHMDIIRGPGLSYPSEKLEPSPFVKQQSND